MRAAHASCECELRVRAARARGIRRAAVGAQQRRARSGGRAALLQCEHVRGREQREARTLAEGLEQKHGHARDEEGHYHCAQEVNLAPAYRREEGDVKVCAEGFDVEIEDLHPAPDRALEVADPAPEHAQVDSRVLFLYHERRRQRHICPDRRVLTPFEEER